LLSRKAGQPPAFLAQPTHPENSRPTSLVFLLVKSPPSLTLVFIPDPTALLVVKSFPRGNQPCALYRDFTYLSITFSDTLKLETNTQSSTSHI
jgi:hypothetical protein